MQYTPLINFKDQFFPFGTVSNQYIIKYRKFTVKKRIIYKNQSEYSLLQQKIDYLNKAHHKNILNIKSIQQIQRGYIDIFYSYVHHKLQNIALKQTLSIKNIHQQLIKMIVHAAKHFIIIPFNSQNCGIKIVNGQKIIKYYFPLNELTICHDIKTIQRNLQLFTVQSMKFLDDLIFGTNHNPQHCENINSRRLSFRNKGYKNINNTNSQLKILSERHFRKSVNLHTKNHDFDFNQQSTDKTVISTSHTIKHSQSQSKQKKRQQKQKSLDKRIYIGAQLRQKIQKLKQRSKKAIETLKLIREQIEKNIIPHKRKYTDELNSLKRFSFDQHVRSILKSSS